MVKNKQTHYEKKAVIFITAFFVFIFSGCIGLSETSIESSTLPATMEIHIIDVGQGDSIFIDYGGIEILIDAGNNQHGERVANYIEKYVDGKIELMIATHPDADHVGGLDHVLKRYEVERVIDSGDTKDTKTYRAYAEAIKNESNCKLSYDEDKTIKLSADASIKIIETGDNYKRSNNNSVVALLTYDKISVLLTGDMEKIAETATLMKFEDIDVLKAAHHGSKTSSSEAFLAVTKPEYVLISAGKNNKYKHPHKTTLQHFFNCGAKVLSTFRSGTIIMETDGSSYHFNSNDFLTENDVKE